MIKRKSKGISVLEVIIGISLVLILIRVAIIPLVDYRASVSVRTQAESIASMLVDAKNKTLSSVGATQYGVHFTTDDYTLFAGASYNSNNSQNVTLTLDSATITDISLQGGGADVVFARLLGTVSSYGTITITSTKDSSQEKIITITKSGAVSVN